MAKASGFPTPLLRVSRPVSACQRCRGAKIKCDGRLPACTACEKAGRSEECSSASDHFARGKERSYVTSLETQVEKLERRIAQVENRKASINLLGVASSGAVVPTSQRPSPGIRKSENQESNNVDDLVSDFGFLSVNATARDFHGFTGEISFARLVMSLSSVEPIATNTAFALPPRYAVTPLIQHYIDNINILYPLISEASLFRSVDKVFGQGGLYAAPIDHWITCMVLATSSASQARFRGDSRYQEALQYTAAALTYVESVIRPGSRPGIQAILLMVLFAMWVPHHYNSWYLIGIASRATVDLGLHQEPTDESQAKTKGSSNDGKIFDCVYSLDRYISMAYQRPFSFTDDSIDVSVPSEPLKPTDTRPLFSNSLKPAENLVKLRRILSESYQKLSQSTPLSFQVAWPIMHASVHDMALWYSASSTHQEDQAFRKFYRREVLYASFLTMTPTRVENPPHYVNFLLLQYAMEYARCVQLAISHNSEATGSWNFHDLQRMSYVAQRFLELLELDHETLLSTPPFTLSDSASGSGPLDMSTAWTILHLPLFLNADVVGRVTSIQGTMKDFDTAIEYFCTTYGYEDPIQKYRRSASTLERILKSW